MVSHSHTTGPTVDERNAMRSFLQRSEVRLSTMHRIASAFLGGAGLLVLFPVFFNQAITTLASVLIKTASGVTLVASGLLFIAMAVSVIIPLYALYLLLRDLVHFYFVGHSPGFSSTLFNPRFVLSGIVFSPDESAEVKHRVYVSQYGTDLLNFVIPFGEAQAKYYTQVIQNTQEQILPEERKIDRLQEAGVLKKDPDSADYLVTGRTETQRSITDINRLSAAFGLAGARERDLAVEVAKIEASLVRHAAGLRRLLLRYIKALLMFILTTLVSFFIAALVSDYLGYSTSVRLLIIACGYAVWALAAWFLVRLPVRWIYEASDKRAESIVDRDTQLIEFEKWVRNLAVGAGACTVAAAVLVISTSMPR